MEDAVENRYLLLYTGGKMSETEAEQRKFAERWQAWTDKHGHAIVDPGNPFTPVTKTVSPRGSVSDGGQIHATGYSVIEAQSINQAIDIAKGCPVLEGGASVSVFETFDAMRAITGAGTR